MVLESDIDFLNLICEYIRHDNPWLYYLDQLNFQTYKGRHYTIIEPVYKYRFSEKKALDRQLLNVHRQVISMIHGVNEWEKVLFIHDLLCQRITYGEIGVESHSIVGSYMNRIAVCDGISKCFKAICDDLCIECCVVSGKAKSSFDSIHYEAHVWNQAKISGQWVNVDVTFDLTMSDKELIRHDYLFLSDDQIKNSHIKTLDNGIQCTTNQLDYYLVNGLVMENQIDFVNFLKRKIQQNKFSFEIKLSGTNNLAEIDKKVLMVIQNTLLSLRLNRPVTIGVNKSLLVLSVEIK